MQIGICPQDDPPLLIVLIYIVSDYRSLYINEDEELTYKEEEAKRQHHQSQNYGEVAYSYDTTEEKPAEVVASSGGRPFVPSAELQIPADMPTPKTAKHNAIIERTALFLAQQGSQMEILMKVKQQGNKNFEFLSHTDPLHAYYLHLKALIKSGSYVPKEQDLDEEAEQEQEEEDEHYLHPSLLAACSNQPSSTPPPVEQKPSKPPPDNSLPPDFVQKIMEVMVKFVIKNGLRFETVIMKRGDLRFSFLNPKNPYNAYYKQQLDLKQKEVDALKKKEETKVAVKRKPLPVCFSIKKPKEEGLEVSSALPVEESSEEEDGTATPPKQAKTASPEPLSATLEKVLKGSADVRKKKNKKDAVVQNERKMKVAQFLKGLKQKSTDHSPPSFQQ